MGRNKKFSHLSLIDTLLSWGFDVNWDKTSKGLKISNVNKRGSILKWTITISNLLDRKTDESKLRRDRIELNIIDTCEQDKEEDPTGSYHITIFKDRDKDITISK